MPFRSERQRKYLWAKRPDIARQWTEEYGSTPRQKAKSSKKRPSQPRRKKG